VARRRSVGGTPATVALTAAGVDFTLHAYDHDPRAASYGLEAAQALGVEPGRVLKTLMASLDGALVVGIVPVDGHLDLKALARALGGSKAVMADVAAAERATGYVAGGISPVGQKRRHPTVLDESATTWPTVFVSGGRRGLDLELSPADLVAVTAATTAPIGR
jgi:Cys-tRNA(Pro)/Cys-tRNA(Cys) deacylase